MKHLPSPQSSPTTSPQSETLIEKQTFGATAIKLKRQELLLFVVKAQKQLNEMLFSAYSQDVTRLTKKIHQWFSQDLALFQQTAAYIDDTDVQTTLSAIAPLNQVLAFCKINAITVADLPTIYQTIYHLHQCFSALAFIFLRAETPVL